MLRIVAATLAHALGTTDVAARSGGEEFVAVLPHADPAAVHDTGERLRALVAQSGPVVNRRRVTARKRRDKPAWRRRWDDTAASLLRRADALLYAAKHAGRSRVCFDVDSGAG